MGYVRVYVWLFVAIELVRGKEVEQRCVGKRLSREPIHSMELFRRMGKRQGRDVGLVKLGTCMGRKTMLVTGHDLAVCRW